MRLFFALWPDGETRQFINRHTRSLVRVAGGRPVPVEKLHLTLAFLGPVGVERIAAIEEAAATVDFEPFELTLDRLGYWPRLRVLWIGPQNWPPQLGALNDGIWTALGTCGFEREARPFRPHLSICRKASPPKGGLARAVSWTPPGFVLVASTTDPRGARYQVLASWPDKNRGFKSSMVHGVHPARALRPRLHKPVGCVPRTFINGPRSAPDGEIVRLPN